MIIDEDILAELRGKTDLSLAPLYTNKYAILIDSEVLIQNKLVTIPLIEQIEEILNCEFVTVSGGHILVRWR